MERGGRGTFEGSWAPQTAWAATDEKQEAQCDAESMASHLAQGFVLLEEI